MTNSEINDLYGEALALVTREKRGSIAFIQRHLLLGYNMARMIIERMEAEKVLGKPRRNGWRRLLK